jgi:K+/H+ antiporter YhaU regulatory subunit KhtT
VLTNPQFYTPIEEGDSVLVIGDMMDHDSEEVLLL